MNIQHLSNSLTVQYSELLQNCIQPLSDGSNISFKSKVIKGKRYWYLYISLGSSRREHYLGEESTKLLDRIEDEKAAWQANEDDRELRKSLVSMLSAGGMVPLARDEGKLLSLLERSGVFLASAVLVGTMAFKAYANMLGVKWESQLATQDVDIAADNRYSLALPRLKKPLNLGQIILDSGLGFFEVPTLNRKQPSTSFKIRGKDFLVDVLTPLRGRESSRPVQLAEFDTFAQPLRHLDYLLEDIQPAVLLHAHGIMVNVPAPARFAIHKCVVSQRRKAAFAAKSRKDLLQSEQVFQVLMEDRPADLWIAFEAAQARGDGFVDEFLAGLGLIGEASRTAVERHLGIA